MTRALLLSLAALGLLAGCESDDSLPSRPRTPNFLTPDDKAQQNAEQRSLEKPAPELPTNPSNLPGQSAAPAVQPVLTLDSPPAADPTHKLGFTGPPGWRAIGHTTGPATVYNHDPYPGVVPHVPPNPGTVPMTGSTPMPGGDFAVDHSWGQSLVLTSTPHRDWPQTTAYYQTANIVNNPIYYFNVQEHLPMKQNDGTYCADFKSALIETPWFYLNTAALPVLMVLEPPDALRTTSIPSADPNFNGYLPPGPVVPAPYPGVLKWDYPFLNPDGTVKQVNGNTATTPQ